MTSLVNSDRNVEILRIENSPNGNQIELRPLQKHLYLSTVLEISRI